MALPGTVSADDLKSPLEEPKQIAPQAALFSLASLEHSSAHFRQPSFTSGWARPTVTKRSQWRRATLHASKQSLNFGGHPVELVLFG